MLAHKIDVVIPEDHQLHVRIPPNIPTGRAELIVLVADERKAQVAREPSREQALARWNNVSASLAADPRPFRELSREERRARLRQLMGSARGLVSTSDEFSRAKQEEIALEERRYGR